MKITKTIYLLFFFFLLTGFNQLKTPFLYFNPNTIKSISDSTKLYVPCDMEVTLWAESPLFYNPTNMDVDIKGRIWITEAKNYRTFNNDPKTHVQNENGDRVIIVEDTDQDGKADKSTVFVEDKDLIAPMGIAVVGNKVYVSASPHMIVYTDTDGDDKADKKEILLTGFGGKDHDHALHSGVVTPDGQFLYNVGNAGPHHVKDKGGFELHSGSVYTGGSPHNTSNEANLKSSDGQVYTGGLALKMSLNGKNTKVLSHNFRNSYEVAIDSYGNMFQNDNDDQVIACRTSFMMEGGNAGFFSADGSRTWQADRRPGQNLVSAQWHMDDPGVTPVGDITGAGSPTGVHIYEGDAFGENFRGTLLSCEAGRNVIYSYKLQKSGAGMILDRQETFSTQGISTSENYIWNAKSENKSMWFRPSDICSGIDGSLFIADWYDPIVGGHAMDDKVGYGRIYRITPKNKKLITPKIDLSTTKGQIEVLCNPAQNVRYLGFEKLLEQNEKVLPDVEELLTNKNPYIQARAIWLMSQLGEKGKTKTFELLKSSNPYHKLVAFRALKESDFDKTLALVKNSTEADLLREMALALKYKTFETHKEIIKEIIKNYDGKDPYALHAIGIMAHQKQEEIYNLVKETIGELPKNWSQKMENLAFELHSANALNDIVKRINEPKINDKQKLKMLTAIAFINTKEAVTAMLSFKNSPNTSVSKMASWWLNFRKNNDWEKLAAWEKLPEASLSSNFKKMKLLSSKLIDKVIPFAQKLKVAETLAKDPDGAEIILDMKANYAIGGKELDAHIAKFIFDNPNANARILASQYFIKADSENYNIGIITRTKGNLIEGQKAFVANCQNCHRHGEDGAEVGPDLTNIHKKYDKTSLLDHVINPSASMVFGYESYNITSKKGKVYYGFMVGENTNSISLKDIAGNVSVIKKDQIKLKTKMPNSLMPDPNAMGLKGQDLANITDYLLSFK